MEKIELLAIKIYSMLIGALEKYPSALKKKLDMKNCIL